jgi:hypothetical protein
MLEGKTTAVDSSAGLSQGSFTASAANELICMAGILKNQA